MAGVIERIINKLRAHYKKSDEICKIELYPGKLILWIGLNDRYIFNCNCLR